MYIELKTNRLTLRPLNIRDLDTVHTYASDIETTKYMIPLPNETIEETSQFLTHVTNEWEKDEPSFYEFAMMLGGVQIGHVSVYLNEQRTEGELGWILNKNYWKKGYATEAAMAVKNFTINELRVYVLVAHCDYRNSSSYNVMKKIGLKLIDDKGIRQYPKTSETARELKYVFNYIENFT